MRLIHLLVTVQVGYMPFKIVGFPQSNLDYLYEKYEEKYIEEKIDEETFFDRNSNSIESYNETLVDPLNEAYSVPEIDDEEDFDAELQETKNYILNLLGSISDVFLTPIFTRKRTTHIYSLWTYIVLTPKNERLSSENFALKYKDFIEMLSNVANATPEKIAEYIAEDKRYNFVNEYYDASIGAATEEPQRKARLNALQEFVNQ